MAAIFIKVDTLGFVKSIDKFKIFVFHFPTDAAQFLYKLILLVDFRDLFIAVHANFSVPEGYFLVSRCDMIDTVGAFDASTLIFSVGGGGRSFYIKCFIVVALISGRVGR